MSRIAEKPKYGTSPQGSGYEYVHRSVCRPAEEPARKGGTLRRRTGGTTRSQTKHHLQVGASDKLSQRCRFTKNCRSLRYFSTDFDTERVENVLSSSPTLAPTFQASGKFSSVYTPTFVERRDFARFLALEFQEPKDFSERNFGNLHFLCKIPIDSYCIFNTISLVNTIVSIPTAYSAPVRLARSDSIDR